MWSPALQAHCQSLVPSCKYTLQRTRFQQASSLSAIRGALRDGRKPDEKPSSRFGRSARESRPRAAESTPYTQRQDTQRFGRSKRESKSRAVESGSYAQRENTERFRDSAKSAYAPARRASDRSDGSSRFGDRKPKQTTDKDYRGDSQTSRPLKSYDSHRSSGSFSNDRRDRRGRSETQSKFQDDFPEQLSRRSRPRDTTDTPSFRREPRVQDDSTCRFSRQSQSRGTNATPSFIDEFDMSEDHRRDVPRAHTKYNASKASSNDPVPIPRTSAASEFLYGVNPVLAALRSCRRRLYKLYVHRDSDADGTDRGKLSPRLKLVTDAAQVAGCAVKNVFDDFLPAMNKMSDYRPHNGFVLECSPLPFPPVTKIETYKNESSTAILTLDTQSPEDAAINNSVLLGGNRPYFQFPSHRQPLILCLLYTSPSPRD